MLKNAAVPLSAASFCKILWVDTDVADPRFVQGVLQDLYDSRLIEEYQTQSTGLRNLGTRQLLRGFRFPLPDIRTQRRVSAVLAAFDELIEINEQRIELLEDLARALYREWFVHFRFPGHQDVEMVDSELGPIPEGWPIRSASDLLDVNPRMQADQALYEKFAMADISERFSHAAPSTTTEKLSGSKFMRGDILFARITPCLENGKTALVLSVEDGAVAVGSTEFIVLRGREVGPALAYCFARDERVREHAVKSMSGASGRQRVAKDCFETFRTLIPPRWLCTRFEDVAMPMFESVAQLRERNETIAATRDLLLPRLVTGRLDISDLDLGTLEPAEAE